jgi:ABC-2 type transport system ATP-binding protein
MTHPAIEAVGLVKDYGEIHALAGLELTVRAGSIHGVLGPNGAGKTTAVRVLTTLVRPDGGRARVAGIDVAAQPAQVRARIGVAAQDATLDDLLTGRQNLTMVGQLLGMRRRTARTRADELLDQFELADAADRVVKGYSGGMRRRLDLAASMLSRPEVLFLDEPTTGLDPTSRQKVWDAIRDLTSTGVTLLLTTQYLDEADRLADRIAVVDHGRVIAEDTSAGLKRAVGGARLHVTLSDIAHDETLAALAPYVEGRPVLSADGRHLDAPVRPHSGFGTAVVRALDAAGVEVDDIEVVQPSLDDVFFALTGHGAAAPEEDGSVQADSAEAEAESEAVPA